MEPLPSYGLSETNFKLLNDGLSETEGVVTVMFSIETCSI
jgi:hypothetical protein